MLSFSAEPEQLVVLRQELDGITKHHFSEHPSLIERLGLQYPHSVEPRAIRQRGDWKTRYNCHAYTFDLLDSPDAESVVLGNHPTRFASRAFVAQLLDEGYLTSVDSPCPSHDGYIVYFRDGVIEHSGKVSNGRIISKWGKLGHLWEHATWEVPGEYGDEAQCFRKIQAEICATVFLEYIRSIS